MKLITCSAVFAAALLTTARADLTIVQQIEGAGPVSEITMKLKGDKARIEASPQVASIIDSKTGEMLNILNEQKMVMRTSAAQAKAAAGAIAGSKGQPAAPAEKVKVTPTGKKETINGFETEEYLSAAPTYKASYWIAKNYPQGAVILKQLQAMTPEAWGSGAAGTPDFRDFPGLPLRTNITMGETKIISTIKTIKMDPLPDSDFTIPPGFKEMKMPNISGMLGKPDASKAAKPAAPPQH